MLVVLCMHANMPLQLDVNACMTVYMPIYIINRANEEMNGEAKVNKAKTNQIL